MKNIKTQFLELSTTSGQCDTFIAYPDDGENHPAIMLYMDIYGPRKYLYEMAQKLAGLGYYVLLPNLFYRARRVPLTDQVFPLTSESRKEALSQVLPLMKAYTPEESKLDSEAFINFLLMQQQVKKGPIGISGYCMGGAIALRAAAAFPDKIGAVASFHGGHLQLYPEIKAQIYAAHADHDQSMNAEMIKKFEADMKEYGIKGSSEVYVGAEHGFTMMDLPVGNPEALKKHWLNLEKLFSVL